MVILLMLVLVLMLGNYRLLGVPPNAAVVFILQMLRRIFKGFKKPPTRLSIRNHERCMWVAPAWTRFVPALVLFRANSGAVAVDQPSCAHLNF